QKSAASFHRTFRRQNIQRFGPSPTGSGAIRPVEESMTNAEKRAGSGQPDGADRDRVLDKVGIRHQGEPEEHRFPRAHSLAVDETDETNAAEEETSEKIGNRPRHHFCGAKAAPAAWFAPLVTRKASEFETPSKQSVDRDNRRVQRCAGFNHRSEPTGENACHPNFSRKKVQTF